MIVAQLHGEQLSVSPVVIDAKVAVNFIIYEDPDVGASRRLQFDVRLPWSQPRRLRRRPERRRSGVGDADGDPPQRRRVATLPRVRVQFETFLFRYIELLIEDFFFSDRRFCHLPGTDVTYCRWCGGSERPGNRPVTSTSS